MTMTLELSVGGSSTRMLKRRERRAPEAGVAATRQSAAVWGLVSGGLPTRRYSAGKSEALLGGSATVERKPRMRMVGTLDLILTFSPGEKEQRLQLSGFADHRPANPVAGFRVRRRMMLPLLGERAG